MARLLNIRERAQSCDGPTVKEFKEPTGMVSGLSPHIFLWYLFVWDDNMHVILWLEMFDIVWKTLH